MIFGPELIVVIIAAVVLLFGGKKVSEFTKSLGRATGEFKKGRLEVDEEIKAIKSKKETTKTKKESK